MIHVNGTHGIPGWYYRSLKFSSMNRWVMDGMNNILAEFLMNKADFTVSK